MIKLRFNVADYYEPLGMNYTMMSYNALPPRYVSIIKNIIDRHLNVDPYTKFNITRIRDFDITKREYTIEAVKESTCSDKGAIWDNIKNWLNRY